MQGYEPPKIHEKWEDTIKDYKFRCAGKLGEIDRAIERHQAAAPKAQPTSQIAQLHKLTLDELNAHRAFWGRQAKAASNDAVLDESGSTEWALTHQTLRAAARKGNRLIQRTAFDSYAGVSFDPNAYEPGA